MLTRAGKEIIIVLRMIRRLLTYLTILKILIILSSKKIEVAVLTDVRILKYPIIAPPVENTTIKRSKIFELSQK